MRAFVLAVAAAVLVALPLPTTAAPVSTDISSQSVTIGPGGVRVHDRWESRRRDRRIHDRYESRGRDRRCVTEYTTRTTPSGRVVREKRTICR
jgi:hypothetical protein